MKILAISHMFLTPFDPFDVAVYEMVKEAIKQGYEIKVVCPLPWVPPFLRRFKKEWHNFAVVPRRMRWNGIETFYPRYVTFPKSLFLASAGTRMYYGIERVVLEIWSSFHFDIVHAHMGFPDGFAAMLVAQKYKRNLVVTIRGSDMLKKGKAWRAIQRVCQQANKVLTPSPHLALRIKEQLGVEPTIIPNGIDKKKVFTGESQLRQLYKGKTVVLSVARLLPSKGIDLTLRAIQTLKAEFPELHYIIVGDGPERQKLQQLAVDLGIRSSVEFVGWQPHEKTMEYMSICDIFCLPSWQETFGLVYLEAMAHGKPVIGCLGQGVDGIVTQGQTGMLVPPRDVESITCTLRYLLHNSTKRREIGQQAKRLVVENYTWEKSAQKLAAVYQEVGCTP